MLPKLTNAHYMTIIDVSLGYYNQNLDKIFLCLTTLACQFGRYTFTNYHLEWQQQVTCFSKDR